MDSLSQRLKFALKKAELSQVNLANKIGVRPQVINYLYQCNPKASKYTYLIADALGVDATWLATGSGHYVKEKLDPFSYAHKIPILSYQQAKEAINNKVTLDKLDITHWITTNIDLKAQSFSIKLKDKSMFPRFDEGALLVFDSIQNIANGIISLIYNKESDDIMVRQIVMKNQKTFLVPINNKNYASFELSPEHIIYGSLKEVRLYEHEHF